MKKLLLSTVALMGFTAGAMAADLPVRTMAPAPAPIAAVPVFTWTGFYVGVSGGYLWNDTDARVFALDGEAITPAEFDDLFGVGGRSDVESDGFLIGGTVGGNIQFGMFVAGVEADLSFADVDGHTTTTFTDTEGFTSRATLRSQMDAFGTLRGRLGVAFDRFMVYGTGGLAFANFRTTGTFDEDFGDGFETTYRGRTDDWQVGWTAGVGAEWAFTNNLTFKIEYLHYEFDDETLNVRAVEGTTTADYNIKHSGDLIRGGINFKF